MRLLTLADGYGDSVAVPSWYPKYWKWPEIIKLMTKNVQLNNCSRYGAGNEFIINQLRENVNNADVVMIQWAQPNRLDLVLDHKNSSYWDQIIANDPVYHNNVVNCGDIKFWISSASNAPAVREYHQKYICYKQHQIRSQIFVDYAKLMLEQRGIDYRFMLVVNDEYLNTDAKWICHEPFKGMHDFRHKSKYSELDLGVVQPIPLVMFDFIKQYIMPDIDLQWRNTREINAVENMLHRHYREALKKRDDSI